MQKQHIFNYFKVVTVSECFTGFKKKKKLLESLKRDEVEVLFYFAKWPRGTINTKLTWQMRH